MPHPIFMSNWGVSLLVPLHQDLPTRRCKYLKLVHSMLLSVEIQVDDADI